MKIQQKQALCQQQKGYLAYQKLSCLNTEIRKLSDKLKDTYGITVGTDHPQFAETSDPIIKCANYNRRTIQNCTSIYQIKLFTVISILIISRRPFAFIKEYISSDPIDYLLCNKFEVHLSDKDSDKANRPQFIWTDFYWSILHCKDTHNNSSSEFIWKIVPLKWREW